MFSPRMASYAHCNKGVKCTPCIARLFKTARHFSSFSTFQATNHSHFPVPHARRIEREKKQVAGFSQATGRKKPGSRDGCTVLPPRLLCLANAPLERAPFSGELCATESLCSLWRPSCRGPLPFSACSISALPSAPFSVSDPYSPYK